MEVEALEVTQTDATDVAADLSANAPVADDVNNTPAPVEEAPKPEKSNLTSDAPKDRDGVVHDPNIHASPPKLAKSGKWMKKRGRGAAKLKEQSAKPEARSFVAQPTQKAEQAQAVAVQQGEAARQAENKSAAIGCTQAIFTIGQAVGGPKFAPGAMVAKTGLNRSHETAVMQDSFYSYFESTGEAFKLPPWAGLAIALTSYGAARMGEKEVHEHVKRGIISNMFGPVGRWWKKRGDRKAARKALKDEQREKTGVQPVDQEEVLEAAALKDMGFV